LNNVFPVLAADPLSGNLFAGWSDAHSVFLSTSTDRAQTWTSPITVNVAPAATAVFPWIAARGSAVDYVYYGTSASSKNDPTAIWNVYMSRSTDGGAHFAQTVVTSHPNHLGVICTNGIACQPGTRNLLDLFQDAISPTNGMAAIIYTDDTLTTQANGSPLPQVVVAYETS
jgi:SAM-dependent methyltransferase